MKNWMKQYGVHIAICIVIAAAAFGINRKINIDRSHVYAVSEPIYTLLKEITEAKTERNALVLSGWGFDTNYYSEDSTCELILQDTETGEALWPKMKRNPEPVQIAERYTDGEDYSAAAFEGRLKASKMKADSVYEILLRYTASYTDENGNEQMYVVTVTTDEFLYQGEMMEYNPKTFVPPEIAGTELEKELEGARLFHYFPEGMWVYYDEEKLYYILDNLLLEGREGAICPVHWFVKNIQNLPEESQPYGFGMSDFYVDSQIVAYAGVERYRVAVIDLPSEYITQVDTGLYYTDTGWVLEKWKQLNY